ALVIDETADNAKQSVDQKYSGRLVRSGGCSGHVHYYVLQVTLKISSFLSEMGIDRIRTDILTQLVPIKKA
ncbi:MAG: hypothetical protein ACI80H_001433, partial [Pseudoalteromonas distincta]